jgi:hypothetical protein
MACALPSRITQVFSAMPALLDKPRFWLENADPPSVSFAIHSSCRLDDGVQACQGAKANGKSTSIPASMTG